MTASDWENDAMNQSVAGFLFRSARVYIKADVVSCHCCYKLRVTMATTLTLEYRLECGVHCRLEGTNVGQILGLELKM